ncbi:MAG: undecaprenyl-diphosphate phosphatase [Hydrogenophaga sp.]|uniref:undecaprenyl-diphosphate phosphatase n=1 Tax=Hydrogenophaga sp. TaxID=1904254 RepID=UPI001D2C5970|nr:undecaprenyl-diphosphate phosphatase [Hydrogenophaga sp.]MBX3611091.1 undecaprenyl-diphosphate phosphatase [Hydrogenophaga sp.]
MDIALLIKAALMGVVEGLTEFLPISSTGHLILAGALLGLNDEKAKVFEVVIQTGAIFAIVAVYAQRLLATLKGLPTGDLVARRFTVNVLVGFFPAALLGFLFIGAIKSVLFNPLVVATSFILGGLVILWAERRQTRVTEHTVQAVDDIRWPDALKVGLIQCLALVPGVSRSGATIIGGMLVGFNRRAATEFSFFLALPVLVGAAVYDLYKHRALLSADDLPFFAVGLVVSWLAAWVCVRWLLRFVASHTFVAFAWYRIAFGVLVLVTAHFGWIAWTD